MNKHKIRFNNRSLQVPHHCQIPVIPGDGIGPEIWKSTKTVIDTLLKRVYDGKKHIEWLECLAGQDAFQKTGKYIPPQTSRYIHDHLVALKGPLMTPVGGDLRSLNVRLRKEFDLYACIRPIMWFPGLVSPVKTPENVSMVIFRENTEDIYVGIEWDYSDPKCKKLKSFLKSKLKTSHIPFDETASIGIKPISKQGSQRLVHAAIDYAFETKRSIVTLVHKGNIMKYTEGKFRDWGYEIAKEAFGDHVVTEFDLIDLQKKHPTLNKQEILQQAFQQGKVYVNDCIADNFFQQALLNPSQFSVIASPNLNGDYISDALAAQVGGLGVAPGANINYENGHAIFEPTHGTAPQLANKNIANPTAMILSARLMFIYLKWDAAAATLLEVLQDAFKIGIMTHDLASQKNQPGLSTSEFTEKLCTLIPT